MKPYTYSLSVFCISFLSLIANAQDKPTLITSPKFVVGIEGGINKECLNHQDSSGTYYIDNSRRVAYPSVGLFARYSFSEHFALQGGVDYNFFQKIYDDYTTYIPGVYKGSLTTTSIDIPLSVQYHMQPRGTKVRSYFGAGLLTRFCMYHSSGEMHTGSTVTPVSFKQTDVLYFPMLSQGITWQMSKKWQFNESVNFMMNYGSSALGFKLGLAYTIK